MIHLSGRRGIAPLAALALVVSGAIGAAPAAAQDDNFTCRASLVRTEGFALPPLNQEPVVANGASPNQCRDQSATLFNLPTNPLTVGPVTVRALFAETDVTDTDNPNTPADERRADAEAGVADVTINQAGLPVIRAQVLTSQGEVTCQGGNPQFTSSSQVVGLRVGDNQVINTGAPQTITLGPAGTLFLNQQFDNADKNVRTQRALHLQTPLGTVTIAEAIVDFHGNPCKQPCPAGQEMFNGKCVPICPEGTTRDPNTGKCVKNPGGCPSGQEMFKGKCVPVCPAGTTRDQNTGQCVDGNNPPQCSDEKDNDGDGKIDYPNDPGCSSYQDDNETDGSTPPQCSDGKDNDGDGQVDFPEDPGCTDRNDNDERNPAMPECSDGVDNDRDGTSDSGDSGCKTPLDDDEAAGFMTGGGGYDEVDKRTGNEDQVEPGTFLRYGTVLPCDVGDSPGPNQTVTWHDPGLQGKWKLDVLTRAYCRNDPFINPGNPSAEFDTYVGEGQGSFTRADGTEVPIAYARFHVIDRGEPGSPPVIGVDYFHIRVSASPTFAQPFAVGFGTLDHGNNQAHTPGSA